MHYSPCSVSLLQSPSINIESSHHRTLSVWCHYSQSSFWCELHSLVLQASLLFAKEEGLLSFLRKSLSNEEVSISCMSSLFLLWQKTQWIHEVIALNNGKSFKEFNNVNNEVMCVKKSFAHVWSLSPNFVSLLPKLRDARVDVLHLLDTFLQRMSTGVKGWEKTYAIDLKV